MKRKIVFIFSFLTFATFGQGRLVLSGNSFIVIDNAAKLVVENPNTNAVSNLGTGGIKTEAEFDQVIWKIGTGTGAYVLPFVGAVTNNQIPFTTNITVAGTGAGEIRFSTYSGATFDNNVYRPSDVTHMFDYNTNTINNSSFVIDRFWIVDANGYTTRPSSQLTFTYIDAEHLQVGNTIVESALGAQRFNAGPNIWGDYLPQGTVNTAANTVTNAPAIPANFFRSWTLSLTTNPLSANVTFLNASCDGEKVNLQWQTENETNVSHFEVEKITSSGNEVIAFIPSQGGNGTNIYSQLFQTIREGQFNLIEVSNDGERTEKATISANCGFEAEPMISFSNNTLQITFDSNLIGSTPISVYDAAGKLVHQVQVDYSNGVNNYSIPDLNFSQGIYKVVLNDGTKIIQQSIFSN